MRIIVIGTESTVLAAMLAERLQLTYVRQLDRLAGDGFVLDGVPRDVDQARALDRLLRSWAIEIDAVLWLNEAPIPPETEAVLEHYLGRVIELDPRNEMLESALDGLRESLLRG